MSKILRLRPSVMCLARRMSAGPPKTSGVTYENKAYPWEGVKIEKLDNSGKYGRVPNSPTMIRMMDDMANYCRDDGLLVWQKNPNWDKFFYMVMMGSLLSALYLAVAVPYTIDNPPCPKRGMPADYYRPEEQDDGKVWHPKGET